MCPPPSRSKSRQEADESEVLGNKESEVVAKWDQRERDGRYDKSLGYDIHRISSSSRAKGTTQCTKLKVNAGTAKVRSHSKEEGYNKSKRYEVARRGLTTRTAL